MYRIVSVVGSDCLHVTYLFRSVFVSCQRQEQCLILWFAQRHLNVVRKTIDLAVDAVERNRLELKWKLWSGVLECCLDFRLFN
jgi:hypothetical protein